MRSCERHELACYNWHSNWRGSELRRLDSAVPLGQ
jgi:hypothetical protein